METEVLSSAFVPAGMGICVPQTVTIDSGQCRRLQDSAVVATIKVGVPFSSAHCTANGSGIKGGGRVNEAMVPPIMSPGRGTFRPQILTVCCCPQQFIRGSSWVGGILMTVEGCLFAPP